MSVSYHGPNFQHSAFVVFYGYGMRSEDIVLRDVDEAALKAKLLEFVTRGGLDLNVQTIQF